MAANVLIAFGGSGAEIGLYVTFNPSIKVLSQGETSRWSINALVQVG